MRWRHGLVAMIGSLMVLASGCAPATWARWVPQLELRLRARDETHVREHLGAPQSLRGRHGWQLSVHANLRWRTGSRPWGSQACCR